MWGPLATSRIRHNDIASGDRIPDCCPSLSDKLPYLVLSWGVGLVTFPSCLGLIQVFVFRPLRLTCSVRGASLLGLCSVTASGMVASLAMVSCTAYLLRFISLDPVKGKPLAYASKLPEYLETGLLYGICSSVIFIGLGGRFSSVLPSSLLHPGAFAKQGISATLRYASAKKRKTLQETGKRHGCHTCGRRWWVKDFIADHQPPNKVVREDMMSRRKWYNWFRRPSPLSQAFYPQCCRCSDVQRTHLRTAFQATYVTPRLRHIVTHPTALRLYHLYLPLPFLIPIIGDMLVT